MEAVNRFTRKQRLLSPKDFSAVFDQTETKVSSRNLLLLARKNRLSCSRLGLVISKKNVGHAVERNRIKRLCREVFRLDSGGFENTDIVLIARKGLGNLDNQLIFQLLESHFSKLKQQPKGAVNQ